jgi:hypothetical protein
MVMLPHIGANGSAGPRIAAHSESEQATITIYGSPTLGGASGGGRPITSVEELGDFIGNPAQQALKLNGEFLIVAETPSDVIIANDRFAALPLFYMAEVMRRNLVMSFSYTAMWNYLSENNKLEPDPLAFFRFLHFQRLFSFTTFDHKTNTLEPASILSLKKVSISMKIERYWKPNFAKRTDGMKAIAADLADAIRSSVARKTIDKSNVSLLLSGGMDSRVVLGGFAANTNSPNCITIGNTRNNEVQVAESLANIVSSKHSFVERSPTHYENVLAEATSTGGGMYSFQHGHFFDLDIPETDLLLHGHGFDYFFQGMYLPASRSNFLGRPTRSWTLDTIGYDLIGQYINEAKYRLKGLDSYSLLKPGIVADAEDGMRAWLEMVLKPVSNRGSDSYDDWDYLTTSAPGRHYTYLNLLSAGTLAEQRTVAFDNDILDIYYSTPAKIRHGTQLLAETIKQLDPRLLKVRNANTNLRSDLSPVKLTVSSWIRGARRRVGAGSSLRPDPSSSDRSWPSESEIIRNSEVLSSRVSTLRKAEGLASLDIFDEHKIGRIADDFTWGNNSLAPALLTLITIDEFIKPSI